jgi:vacuolar-type H+-ATPase subunit E/Vma4
VSGSALRTVVLRQAEADAEAVLAESAHRAAVELDQARRAAGALVDRARVEGETAGALETARARAAARATAQRLVLDARREVFEELRRRCREAALALRRQEGYALLLDRLAGAARDQLGRDAEVDLDPPGAGGVRARAGARRVDYTLPVLVDRCLEDLGRELERLW